jgi:hypothetical protein
LFLFCFVFQNFALRDFQLLKFNTEQRNPERCIFFSNVRQLSNFLGKTINALKKCSFAR